MERLILPPKYPKTDGPIIFLAGPIQGAFEWQSCAAEYINYLDPLLWIASPRRGKIKLGDVVVFNEQVDWETHFLNRAATEGVILFWLAKEYSHACGRPYAQTTRFELAEWKVKHERDVVKLALGIESGFSNENYIRRRFNQDCPEILIQRTLEETCREAVLLACPGFSKIGM